MNLMRKNDLFSVMDEFLNGFEKGHVIGAFPQKLKTLDERFSPTLELSETKTNYLVEIDVPGMEKKDIELNFEDNTLFIKGEKKEYEKKEDEVTRYTERFYGSFMRKIPLSEDVDPNKIEANYSNGVLKISLAKKPTDTPTRKTISIN